MMNFVDRGLNHITMYRLVLYYLAALLVVAFGFSFFGLVPTSPLDLIFSGAFILLVCWIVNRAFGALLRIPVNAESVYITAAILALIMPPVAWNDLTGMEGLALASAAGIASKFLLTFRRKHIFNPVAVGAIAPAFLLDQPATWWAGGNLAMLSFVIIGGLLVVRKVQRFEMMAAYVLASVVATFASADPEMYGEAARQSFIYSPLLFAGFSMLTEPLTAPAGRWSGIAYGALIGALATPNMHVGEFYFTPEIAFVVGNVFAFILAPHGRFKLTLLRVEELAAGCYNFVFASNRKLPFKAGQYLDWTMHVADADDRGNRRPFTVASSPNDHEVHLGVKFYAKPSAFKRSLLELKEGDVIYGSQIAGDFTLPRNTDEKLAFIAGGIGVTPFTSMVKDMLHRQDRRSVVMLYGNNTIKDIAYADVFDRAERELGIRTVYAVADGKQAYDNLHPGFIDAGLIKREMPDYRERTYYVSGPRSMVLKFKQELKALGVSRSRIKVDFFPGFA
jgi:glycine betaine catabolism B